MTGFSLEGGKAYENWRTETGQWHEQLLTPCCSVFSTGDSACLKKKKTHLQNTAPIPGLQITVCHRTLADQNLFVSNEIPTVVGHDVRTNFLS